MCFRKRLYDDAAEEKLLDWFPAILTRASLPLSSAFLNFLLMLP